MAKKIALKKSPKMADRLDTIERLVRTGFRRVDRRFEQVDQRFEQSDRRQSVFEFELGELKRQISEQGATLELRIDRLANHVDGFMKLHETLDIEFKVLKEQMNRVEARLNRLEAERTT
jgi:chromosome segregation ATPase